MKNKFIFAAAGMAGMLCAAGNGIPAMAAVPDTALPVWNGTADRSSSVCSVSSAFLSTPEESLKTAETDEPDGLDKEEVLRRWGLDPESFPAEEAEEEALPDPPKEELLPWFSQAVREAVQSYAGSIPPVPDQQIFSPRDTAVKTAVREAAQKDLREKSEALLDSFIALIRNAGEKEVPSLWCSLQDHSSRLRADGDYSQMFVLKQDEHDPGHGQDPSKADPDAREENRQETDGKGSSEDHSGAQEQEQVSSIREFLKDAYPFPDSEKKTTEASEPADAAFRQWLSGKPSGEIPDDLLQLPKLYAVSVHPSSGRDEAAAAEEQASEEEPSNGYAPENDPSGITEETAENDLAEKQPAELNGFLPLSNRAASGQSVQRQRRTVFIGDSRTVGMEIYCGGQENEYWIARNSMGYSWMADSAIKSAEPLIEDGTDVVILMGVNDLGNVGRYVDLMNRKAAEWKKLGARTFFVSVTPVDDRRSPNAKNSRIEAFNAYAQEYLDGVIYIDAYSRIRDNFGTPDGIHFSAGTYRDIYRIIHFSLYSGWYEEAGLWFYFDRGKPMTGWLYLDGKWQYMDGNGVRWIRDGRVGDVYLAPYPETGMLDPLQGAFVEIQ